VKRTLLALLLMAGPAAAQSCYDPADVRGCDSFNYQQQQSLRWKLEQQQQQIRQLQQQQQNSWFSPNQNVRY
jgi:hypothetical protein